MALYKVLINSGEFRVLLITLGLQPYSYEEFNSYFFFGGLVDYVLLSFLDSIPICFKCNIASMSLPNKLAGCCLQICVIVAS